MIFDLFIIAIFYAKKYSKFTKNIRNNILICFISSIVNAEDRVLLFILDYISDLLSYVYSRDLVTHINNNNNIQNGVV